MHERNNMAAEIQFYPLKNNEHIEGLIFFDKYPKI